MAPKNRTPLQKFERFLLTVTLVTAFAVLTHLAGAEVWRALYSRDYTNDVAYQVILEEASDNLKDNYYISEYNDTRRQKTITGILEQSTSESRFQYQRMGEDSFYSGDAIVYGNTISGVDTITSIDMDNRQTFAYNQTVGGNPTIEPPMIQATEEVASVEIEYSSMARPIFMGGLSDSRERAVAKDNSVSSTSVEKHTLTPNPQVTPKRSPLYWYEGCSIYAAVAKFCYNWGYKGGEPVYAVIEVNKIIGHYYGPQYTNCWNLTELGNADRVVSYEALDTDSIMMIIDDVCKQEDTQ